MAWILQYVIGKNTDFNAWKRKRSWVTGVNRGRWICRVWQDIHETWGMGDMFSWEIISAEVAVPYWSFLSYSTGNWWLMADDLTWLGFWWALDLDKRQTQIYINTKINYKSSRGVLRGDPGLRAEGARESERGKPGGIKQRGAQGREHDGPRFWYLNGSVKGDRRAQS